jgi:hypothetical protein
MVATATIDHQEVTDVLTIHSGPNWPQEKQLPPSGLLISGSASDLCKT